MLSFQFPQSHFSSDSVPSSKTGSIKKHFARPVMVLPAASKQIPFVRVWLVNVAQLRTLASFPRSSPSQAMCFHLTKGSQLCPWNEGERGCWIERNLIVVYLH